MVYESLACYGMWCGLGGGRLCVGPKYVHNMSEVMCAFVGVAESNQRMSVQCVCGEGISGHIILPTRRSWWA